MKNRNKNNNNVFVFRKTKGHLVKKCPFKWPGGQKVAPEGIESDATPASS